MIKRQLNIVAVLSGRRDLLSDKTHTSMKRDLYSWKETCIHEKKPTKKTVFLKNTFKVTYIHEKTPSKETYQKTRYILGGPTYYETNETYIHEKTLSKETYVHAKILWKETYT